ncbi:MAG TPA: molybdate ABC transporter substrate-binding protein [Acidimicrobiia bacterium]
MRQTVGAVVLLTTLVAACARSGDDSVRVLAAASLTEAFEALAERFEATHPGLDVDVGFGASSELAAQIEQGAPADVFASADEVTMERVVERGGAGARPVVFARNRLAIAVEHGNPEGITGLDDLDRPGLVVILCAQQVPCGRFADAALRAAGVAVTPASRAANVKAALSPVALGEADAAIVYVTDVESSGAVDAVPIPEDVNVVGRYPIVSLAGADHEDGAAAFVEFVRSERGQRVLREFGFLSP